MEPTGLTRVERRLAAILAADVAGYSRLIEADEEGTLSRLKALRAEVIDPKSPAIGAASSRPPATGFSSSSPASSTRCAAELQAAMAETNAPLPPDRRIEFHIGINVGDIVVEDGDIFGDGVNVGAPDTPSTRANTATGKMAWCALMNSKTRAGSRRSRVRTRLPLERGCRAPAAAAYSRAAAGPVPHAQPQKARCPSPPGGPPAGRLAPPSG
jgi:hypothetical protein